LPAPVLAGSNSVTVSTFAGDGTAAHKDGTGTAAQFAGPLGITILASGTIYVADSTFDPATESAAVFGRIRRVSRDTAEATTIAGDGTAGGSDGIGAQARFRYPFGVAGDGEGAIFVMDSNNHALRKVFRSGLVYTPALSSTTGGALEPFNLPHGVALDGGGTLYVADSVNRQIRKINPEGAVSLLTGTGISGVVDGPPASARFMSPIALTVDATGNVYVADDQASNIRKITPAGVVTTLAGASGGGYADGPGSVARFNKPHGVAVDAAGNVYVADYGNHRIRLVAPDGRVSTLAGVTDSSGKGGHVDGAGDRAKFNGPIALALDPGGLLYVSDYGNHRIRKVAPSP
jgi:streptogramin lyase